MLHHCELKERVDIADPIEDQREVRVQLLVELFLQPLSRPELSSNQGEEVD